MHGGFAIAAMYARTLLGLLACGVSVPAQESPFVELQRWHWRSPDVLCGSCDESGRIAAYGTHDPRTGWELVLYDPRERTELGRFPLHERPVDVRFRDAQHVEVRLPDSDAFLSLSHWHRLRRSDGVEVGEPVLCRVEDDDPAARARFRGREKMGLATGLCLDEAGTLCWWQQGKAHAITDRLVHDLVWTPDGRFVLVWLPSRLVVVNSADGSTKLLPVHSEDVRAVVGGSNGDEVLVVGTASVQVVRASTGVALRTVPHPGEHVVAAALVPGGSELAMARGTPQDDIRLLELQSGRTKVIDRKATAIAWSPDGRRLACFGEGGFAAFDRDGRALWDGGSDERAAGRPNTVVADGFVPTSLATYYTNRWRLLALDGDLDAFCCPLQSVGMLRGALPAESLASELQLWGSLGARELLATKDDRMHLCDGAWRSTAALDVGAPISLASVSRTARRVAVVTDAELL
ncbi:MAG TPA: hypothetical protein VFZ65_03520, partial [Planctomycetota bacterium]|nr:hypothetical protein [Planctomycetota bacterium]